jgi:hypothetical protein
VSNLEHTGEALQESFCLLLSHLKDWRNHPRNSTLCTDFRVSIWRWITLGRLRWQSRSAVHTRAGDFSSLFLGKEEDSSYELVMEWIWYPLFWGLLLCCCCDCGSESNICVWVGSFLVAFESLHSWNHGSWCTWRYYASDSAMLLMLNVLRRT